MRPVFFLSDFGLEDPYVGVVKAVLWEKAPGVPVLDLAHALPPQDLRRAAYALFEALPYLPEQAVVLAELLLAMVLDHQTQIMTVHLRKQLQRKLFPKTTRLSLEVTPQKNLTRVLS